jgi:GTPase involved in cell partitioning and DNA repair
MTYLHETVVEVEAEKGGPHAGLQQHGRRDGGPDGEKGGGAGRVVVALRRQLRAAHRGGRRQCKGQDQQAAARERPRLARSCRGHVALAPEGCHGHGMHRQIINSGFGSWE